MRLWLSLLCLSALVAAGSAESGESCNRCARITSRPWTRTAPSFTHGRPVVRHHTGCVPFAPPPLAPGPGAPCPYPPSTGAGRFPTAAHAATRCTAAPSPGPSALPVNRATSSRPAAAVAVSGRGTPRAGLPHTRAGDPALMLWDRAPAWVQQGATKRHCSCTRRTTADPAPVVLPRLQGAHLAFIWTVRISRAESVQLATGALAASPHRPRAEPHAAPTW